MASSSITWWQIDRGKSGDNDRFYFLGLQITVDCDCRCKIKRFLLLGRKDMTNLDSILKSKDIILPTKIHLVKAMFFPIVMYGCEGWNHKEGWESNNWYFWIVVLEKTVESPFAARRSNQSIPKEINPEYFLEGLAWKLKLQSFGHLMRTTDSLGKILMLGKIKGKGETVAEDEMVR